MPTYLVESYASNGPERIDDVCERACLAAELATDVGYLRTTFVPGDEVVLHLFEAQSEEALRAAVSSAGLEHDRIVQAVEAPGGGGSTTSAAGSSPGRREIS